MKFSILYFLLFLLISSCSSVSMVQTPPPKILTAREKLLLYYKELRQSQWDKIKQKNERRPRKVTIIPKKAEIKLVDLKEQSIEIEQNLTYFCMEQRKSNKFMIPTTCQKHTQNIYNECNLKFVKGDARLTRCVVLKLK